MEQASDSFRVITTERQAKSATKQPWQKPLGRHKMDLETRKVMLSITNWELMDKDFVNTTNQPTQTRKDVEMISNKRLYCCPAGSGIDLPVQNSVQSYSPPLRGDWHLQYPLIIRMYIAGKYIKKIIVVYFGHHKSSKSSVSEDKGKHCMFWRKHCSGWKMRDWKCIHRDFL